MKTTQDKSEELAKFNEDISSVYQDIISKYTPEIRNMISEADHFIYAMSQSTSLDSIIKKSLIACGKEELISGELVSHKLYFEIAQYLDLIRTSIITQRNNILYEPPVLRSLEDLSFYISCLQLLKERIPPDISSASQDEIRGKISYLSSRLETL